MEKGDASKETKKWFFIIKKKGGFLSIAAWICSK
jgi:hypothetical protein